MTDAAEASSCCQQAFWCSHHMMTSKWVVTSASDFSEKHVVAAAAKLVGNRMKLQLTNHQLQRLREPLENLSATHLTVCTAVQLYRQ